MATTKITTKTTEIEITRNGNPYVSLGTVDFDTIVATDNAEPSSRVLDGSLDYGAAEEWLEPCTLPDGRKGRTVYLFDADDIVDSNGEPLQAEDYPWDAEHCRRVMVD